MGCRLAKTALYEQFARVGKALASPRRLELLDLLAQGERSVEDLAGAAVSAFLGPGGEEVTREELLDRVRSGNATVIDVRPPEEFAAGHIPGAVSIPLEELAEHLDELPADETIVAYCRGAYCVLAYDAVRLLTDRGRSAVRLADGMLEWRLASLPIETAA